MPISKLIDVMEDDMYITVVRRNDIMFEGTAYKAKDSLRGWNAVVFYIDDGRSQGFSKGLYIEVE